MPFGPVYRSIKRTPATNTETRSEPSCSYEGDLAGTRITVPGEFGARIGDSIVVTNNGFEYLTPYPKGLRVL